MTLSFELDEVPLASSPVDAAGNDGLGALFARATFEPVVPSIDAVLPQAPAVAEPSVLQPDQASLDQFAAQLDDFDEPADLPELPLDAFLSKADDATAPQAEVFAAASTDDEWPAPGSRPARQRPIWPELNAVPVLMPEPDASPVLQSSPPLLTDAAWEVTGTTAALASDAANPAAEAGLPEQPAASALKPCHGMCLMSRLPAWRCRLTTFWQVCSRCSILWLWRRTTSCQAR